MTLPDLQALNRYVNGHYEHASGYVAYADEGKPGIGWDCRGFAALKAYKLMGLGVSQSEMRVLDTDFDGHMVLEVKTSEGSCIMDDQHDECGRPGYYSVDATVPAFALQAWIPQARDAR